MNVRSTSFLALLFYSCLSGCDHPPSVDSNRASESATSDELKRAITGMMADADITSDRKYQQLLQKDQQNAIAPTDMRHMLTSWEGRKSLRKWPSLLRFTYDDERVRLSWSGEIGNSFPVAKALERFDAAMKERGYDILVEAKAVNDLRRRLGLPFDKEPLSDSPFSHGYTRTVGETQLAAFAHASDYTGGRLKSGVEFCWIATRTYPDQPPTLGEALDAVPKMFRVPFLKPSFFEALASEKVVSCYAGRGLGIEFKDDVYDRLVKALEATGFEYYDELGPLRNGTQKRWYRFTDVTYAQIITNTETKHTRFSCQEPQHKGEPKTTKPPLPHPSLRVPLAKRLVLELDQISFADPELQKTTRIFHDFAETIAGDDWFVHQYKDMRNSSRPSYVAKWQNGRRPRCAACTIESRSFPIVPCRSR